MNKKDDKKLSKPGLIAGILGAIGAFSITKGLADSVVDTKNPLVKAGITVAEITVGIFGLSASYRMTTPVENAYKKTVDAYRKEKEKSEEDEEDSEE